MIRHICALILALYALPAAAEPLDEILSFPVKGFWNGFNDQVNVIECSNFNTTSVELALTLNNSDASELATGTISIPANSTVHTVLNEFEIINAIGSYDLALTSTPSSLGGRITCDTVIYNNAPAGADKIINYAIALPIRNALTGESSGTFNSIDPESAGNATLNYLTVLNSGASAFNAELIRYAQDGSQLTSTLIFDLQAGERRDISLDEGGQEEIVGFYRIVPVDNSAPYHAFVTRYAQRGVFAFSLLARAGTCTEQLVPLSSMDPADNWVEIANAKEATASVTIEVRDNSGTVLQTETRNIQGFSQYHFYANSIIGERAIGSVRVSCSDPLTQGIHVQSIYYGRNAGNTLEWAYAAQADGIFADAQTELVLATNTFLGAQNWIKELNSSAADFSGSMEVLPDAGAMVSTLATRNTKDTSYNALTSSDVVGAVGISSSAVGSKLGAELIRVFYRNDGGIGYILRIAPKVISKPQVELETVINGLSQPLYLANAGDASGRIFIVEKLGQIKVWKSGAILPTPFIDLSASLPAGAALTEQGMNSMAFHPNFSTNGKVYIMFIESDGDSRLSEFSISGNPDVLNPASERIILTQSRADTFHLGGQVEFGSDGYLYFSFGDGGPQEDPLGEAQNTLNLNGTISRIDVDGAAPYTIPADNPFVGDASFRDEIWAYGFRNPYRFSFDPTNDRMIAGDVGQVSVEEVDIVTKGGNYGWNFYEGTQCFRPSANPSRLCADQGGLTFPIHDYPRADGGSVIGGYVYRGSAIPSLQGAYIFADFNTRHVWALREGADGSWERSRLFTLPAGQLPTSFGVDEDGELYLVDILGRIFQFTAP